MEISLVNGIFSAFFAAIYIMFATLVNQRGVGFGRITRFMLWYSLFSAFWYVLQYLKFSGVLIFLGPNFLQIEEAVGVFLFFAILSVANVEFLGYNSKYFILPAVGIVLSLFSICIVIFVPEISLFVIHLINFSLAGLWIVLVFFTFYTALKVFYSSELDIQRQRLFIWISAISLTALGCFAILFLQQKLIGNILNLVGFTLCGYPVFIHNRLDLLWSGKRILTFVLQGLLGFLIYALVLSIPLNEVSFSGIDNFQLDLGIKIFLLLMFVNPMLSMAADYFSRLFIGFSLDQSALIRTFNSKISGSLSVEILARFATNYLRDILGLEFCTLLLVRKDEKKGNYLLYFYNDQLASLKLTPAVTLDPSSPITQRFLTSSLPLLKNEILSQEDITNQPMEENNWIAEQPYTLYAPIKTENDWLGVYALGPKSSGERFYPRDLELLGTVSEQTTTALARAILYERTMRINAELQAAQEELVRTNKKLREMDETKTAFIGVISHELRTPLANIQFSMQVLEMYYRTQMSGEQKAQFEDLNKSVKQARSMIDNLIIFASFLNQQAKLNISEYEFREVLREALTILRYQIEAKNLKVHINIMGDRLNTIGDRKLVREAVVQLVSNAVKFTTKGDVWVTVWISEGALCFDVKDTGIGISPEKIDRVWGAFNQLEANSVQRGVEGLGLGLGLVKYIVNAHGGLVWVESTPGQGSTFGFQLPIRGPEFPLEKNRENLKC